VNGDYRRGRVTRSLALALLIVLAGCAGHSDQSPAPKPAPAPHQPQPRDPANEPYGRLSPSEKRAIVREYRLLQPLQNGDSSQAALDRGTRVCQALTDPQTTLVARVRSDCLNAVKFFAAMGALDRVGHDCNALRDYPTCEQARFESMAKALRQTGSGASAINDELRRRGITGLCANSIGITQPQLQTYRRAEQAARNAANALATGNAPGFQNATEALTRALGANSSGGDPLSGIRRGCATSKPRPLPKIPTPGGINA
jgi:hypothetical protein